VALTSLKLIKAISRGEVSIQALGDKDELVIAVLAQVDLEVTQGRFGNFAEPAQRYLAAHYLVQALRDAAGARGVITSESVGDVSQSFGQSFQASRSVLGATQYGAQFLEYRNKVIVSAITVPPACP
jgi:hypothetical protein